MRQAAFVSPHGCLPKHDVIGLPEARGGVGGGAVFPLMVDTVSFRPKGVP